MNFNSGRVRPPKISASGANSTIWKSEEAKAPAASSKANFFVETLKKKLFPTENGARSIQHYEPDDEESIYDCVIFYF